VGIAGTSQVNYPVFKIFRFAENGKLPTQATEVNREDGSNR